MSTNPEPRSALAAAQGREAVYEAEQRHWVFTNPDGFRSILGAPQALPREAAAVQSSWHLQAVRCFGLLSPADGGEDQHRQVVRRE